MDVSTAKKKATHQMVYKDGISNVMDKAFRIALRFSFKNLIGSEPLKGNATGWPTKPLFRFL